MKKNSTLLGFLMLSFIAFGQIQQGGVPVSSLKTNLQQNIPLFETAELNIQALKNEDLIVDEIDDIPWRYGYIHYVDLTMEDGIYDELVNGDRIWRLKISAPNAQTINLTFNEYKLMPGAQLFIYTENYENVLGAFTSENNKDHSYLTTTLIEGDEITIELFEPANTVGFNRLNLERIVHGYRSLDYPNKDEGDSGDCNNNVICSIGDNWREQIRSVGILLSQNNTAAGFCSGALINNTCNDGRPYFLTANHCGADVATTVVGFNFESTQCAVNTGPYLTNTVSGVTLLASNPGSDFMLLELSSNPPASYNVFYAGWDRSTNLSTSQVGIHHPAGDLKKISLDDNSPTTAVYSNAQCWRVGSWEDGTTEGGSSGSPLFNQNGNIIGQLYGGGAACGNTEPDFYGRFDISWDNGTGPGDELKTWLDPCNTNDININGYDPNTIVLDEDAALSFSGGRPTTDICGDKIPQILTLRNRGFDDITSAEISYGVDGNLSTFNWTGLLTSNQSEQIVLDSLSFVDGFYNYEAYIVSTNLSIDENLTNDSIDFEIIINNGIRIELNIQTNLQGGQNYFEILDANDNIVEEEGPFASTSNYSFSYCLPEGDYCVKMYDDGGNGLEPLFFFDQGNFQLIIGGNEIYNSDALNGLYEYCFSYSSPVTSILNVKEKIEFDLFPNPNNGNFTVSSEETMTQLNITDITGAVVYSKKLNSKSSLIRTNNLSKGVYYVKVNTNNGNAYSKIIVE